MEEGNVDPNVSEEFLLSCNMESLLDGMLLLYEYSAITSFVNIH